jgi:hypothetical protein
MDELKRHFQTGDTRQSFATTFMPLHSTERTSIRNDLFFSEMMRFDKMAAVRARRPPQCVQLSYRLQSLGSGSDALWAFSNETLEGERHENDMNHDPFSAHSTSSNRSLWTASPFKVITLNPSLIQTTVVVRAKTSFVEFIVFLGNVIAFWLDVNFADILIQSASFAFKLRVYAQIIRQMRNPRKQTRLRANTMATSSRLPDSAIRPSPLFRTKSINSHPRRTCGANWKTCQSVSSRFAVNAPLPSLTLIAHLKAREVTLNRPTQLPNSCIGTGIERSSQSIV